MPRRHATARIFRWAALTAAVLGSLLVMNASALGLPASIDSETATGVTQTDATLNAEINPNGMLTAYEFQIDVDSSFDYTKRECPLELPGYFSCMVIGVGEPLPAGLVEPSQQEISAGSGDQLVSVDLASVGATLTAGTTYHFRAIATNGAQGEEVTGATQSFETLPGAVDEPPVSPPAPPPVNSGSTPERCVVPKLGGRSLVAARPLLRAAHCRLGHVTTPLRHHGTLIVRAQSPRGGESLAAASAVAVRLGTRHR